MCTSVLFVFSDCAWYLRHAQAVPLGEEAQGPEAQTRPPHIGAADRGGRRGTRLTMKHEGLLKH